MGVAAAFVALMTAWIGLGIGGDGPTTLADDLGTALAALVACVLCGRAAVHHQDRLRLFWGLLAAACAFWTLAEVIWAFYDLVLKEDVPVPSWADVGYLAALPTAVAALLFHPAMHGSGVRKARAVIDGLMVAAALLFLSWTLVLGSLWKNTDLSTAGGFVSLAYVFGDVVVIFFIVLILRGLKTGDRQALWWLLGGLLLMSVTDSTYAYLTEVAEYSTGDLVDVGWIVSYLAIALGAFCAVGQRVAATRPAAPQSSSLMPIVAPFLPIFLALGVLAVGHRLDDVGYVMAFGLIALVLVRQGLLVFDLVKSSEAREIDLADRVERAALGIGPEHAVVHPGRPGEQA